MTARSAPDDVDELERVRAVAASFAAASRGKAGAESYMSRLSGGLNASGRNAGDEYMEQLARGSSDRRPSADDGGNRNLEKINAGEEYMQQLSRQSSARRRDDPLDGEERLNLEKVNPGQEYMQQLARQSASRRRDDADDEAGDGDEGRNAGEEYIAQLARQSAAGAREWTEEDADVAPPVRSSADLYMEQLSRQSAGASPQKPAPPSVTSPASSKRAMRDPFDDEPAAGRRNAGEEYLAQLSGGAAESGEEDSGAVEAAIARMRAKAEADVGGAAGAGEGEREGDVDREIARMRAEVAELEAELGGSAGGVEGGEGEEMYDSMRGMLADHVSRPVDAVKTPPKTSVVVDVGEPAVGVSDASAEAKGDVQAAAEPDGAQLALVEIKIEMRKYADAARELQEKHDRAIESIIERYMPGL